MIKIPCDRGVVLIGEDDLEYARMALDDARHDAKRPSAVGVSAIRTLRECCPHLTLRQACAAIAFAERARRSSYPART